MYFHGDCSSAVVLELFQGRLCLYWWYKCWVKSSVSWRLHFLPEPFSPLPHTSSCSRESITAEVWPNKNRFSFGFVSFTNYLHIFCNL